MKKFMSLVFILQAINLQSQVSLSAGYNAFFVRQNIVDDIIDRYNSTRSWLDKEMKPLHAMHGLRLGISTPACKTYAIGLNYESAWRTLKAEGTQPNGETGWRKVNAFQHSILLSLSGRLNLSDQLRFRPGFTLDLTLAGINTRYNTADSKEVLLKRLYPGSHFFIKTEWMLSNNEALGVELYYLLPYAKANFYPTEQSLDAVNASSFDPDDFLGKLKGFGIAFYILL